MHSHRTSFASPRVSQHTTSMNEPQSPLQRRKSMKP